MCSEERPRALPGEDRSPRFARIATLLEIADVAFGQTKFRPLIWAAREGPDFIEIVLMSCGKLFNPTTNWFRFSRASSKFEPMKPATPLISQVFGAPWSCCRNCLYRIVRGCFVAEAVDPFRVPRTHWLWARVIMRLVQPTTDRAEERLPRP